MNIKDFKWTEKRFGTTFANILKKLGGLSKDGTDGSIEYKDDDGNVSKLVTDSNFGSLLAKNGLIEVKWQELKDKRDNGELIPGSLYRITDYQCTTTQENTRSAGHQFDIVLLALSENKLAEEGWAMMHDNIYDVTFANGVTIKCYVYYDSNADMTNIIQADTKLGMEVSPDTIVIDEENKTVDATDWDGFGEEEPYTYNYFQNSNLSAWKVWYCLDNDKSRFAWADDEIRLKISVNGNVYITTGRVEGMDEGEYLYWGQQYENGGAAVYSKGTPKIGDSVYNWTGSPSSPIWMTLGVVEEIEITNGRGVIYRLIDEFNNDVAYDFKNIQYIRPLTDGEYDADNGEDVLCYTFTWIDENNETKDASIFCQNIAADEGFVLGVYDNSMLHCMEYDFVPQEHSDKLAFVLNNNVFISTYQYESGIFYGIYGNYFSTGCHSNTFGNSCILNIFRNTCHSNIFGYECRRNTFGAGCYGNTFGNYFDYNTFGNECSYNIFGHFCNYNTFGNGCSNNTFGKSFYNSHIGNGVNNITVSKDNVRSIIIEDYNANITITSTATTSETQEICNIAITLGTNNSSVRKTISHNTTNDTFKTTYQNSNSTTKNV